MTRSRKLHLFGYASGAGAGQVGSQDGPLTMQGSKYLKGFLEEGIILHWRDIIRLEANSQANKQQLIVEANKKLAQAIQKAASQNEFFCVIGGDHSCGIGTWSGLSSAFKSQGEIGLIWIDAHMDSHTPHTTPSGNIHGMPVASLLGYGIPSLTEILFPAPKIKPENLCLIGVRSFERGEAALLKELNVRVYFMEEVRERGFQEIIKEATEIVSRKTIKYGISIDIDGIDPSEAPGTGCPVANGISSLELFNGLQLLAEDPRLAGFEIVEFDPHLDHNHKTEKIVAHLIGTLIGKDCHAFF